jgi:transposase-like protein
VRGLIDHTGAGIELRQSKYPDRTGKRRTRPLLGLKDFHSAAGIIAGIEAMHMTRKGQLDCSEGQPASAADQFYSQAFCGRPLALC